MDWCWSSSKLGVWTSIWWLSLFEISLFLTNQRILSAPQKLRIKTCSILLNWWGAQILDGKCFRQLTCAYGFDCTDFRLAPRALVGEFRICLLRNNPLSKTTLMVLDCWLPGNFLPLVRSSGRRLPLFGKEEGLQFRLLDFKSSFGVLSLKRAKKFL